MTGGEATAEAERALDLLDLARRRFINVAGHELRTPITTIRGLADELLHANDDAIRDELVPALIRNAERVEKLLDDLLVAAEITTALPVGDPEPVDVVATAMAIWDASGTGLDLELEGERSALASLRAGAADRILGHVLENAIRYGKPPITLRASQRDGRVVLECASGGEAVRDDDVALAFELFYRGEGAVTAAPGFGLGLPVARALARQHDGDVAIAANPGGGVVVTIELPAA